MSNNMRMVAKNLSEQQLMDVVDSVMTDVKALGASACEVSIDQGHGMSICVRQDEVEIIEHNRDKSLGLTVYFGHHSGNASTTDFSKEAIRFTISAASNIAKYTEKDPFSGLADEDLLAVDFPDLALHHPWQLEIPMAIEIARTCEQAALQADKSISNTEGAAVSSHEGVGLYGNSYGFRGFSSSSRHSLSCSVLAGKGEGMQRDYWYDSQRAAEDIASPQTVGVTAARRTARRLNARKIKTGNYPVIFETGLSASLFSHLTSAISGSRLYRKASFLLDKKGAKIFPENLHIHEQPRLLKGAGSAVFDSEGVATQANEIVRNGVLQSYLLDSYSARKLGYSSTGNAGGVHNLTIDSTSTNDLDGMIKDMREGLLITELIGHGVNTLTGDYSRGAFGFWVEQGEIQHPVQEITIAGNLQQMFLDIVQIGSDVDQRKNIRSGSVMLEKMTVAGV